MQSRLLIALILVTAACTSGSGDDSDLLSRLRGPATTLTPPVTAPTPQIASTVTTSTTPSVVSPTTTIADSTEVLGAGGSEGQVIQKLPLTGVEPRVAFIALVMLTLGVWLIRKASIAQSIVDRIRSNLTRP